MGVRDRCVVSGFADVSVSRDRAAVTRQSRYCANCRGMNAVRKLRKSVPSLESMEFRVSWISVFSSINSFSCCG